MIKRRISISLILLMLITPIVSAFEHCVGMTMSDHLPENLNLVTNFVSNAAIITSKHQKPSEVTHQENAVQHCQSSGNCNFHFCSNGFGIPTSLSNNSLLTSYIFSPFESSSLYRTPISPEIRPPIIVL